MCALAMFVLVQTQEEDVWLGVKMWGKPSVELSDTPPHNTLADNLDAKLD